MRDRATKYLLLAVAFAMISCSPTTQGGPRSDSAVAPSARESARPKQVTAVVMGNITALSTAVNPPGSAGSVPGLDSVEEMINTGLATYDDKGTLQPRLASAVPSLENGLWKVLPDGTMETTWQIRPGAAWHDGHPFTSEDILFTARVGREREVPAFNDPGYALIDQIDAPDASTITVHWRQAFNGADRMFTRTHAIPLPKHLLEAAYNDNRATFTDLPYWTTEFVGTGAYKLRELVESSYLMLAANDSYVMGRPKIDMIEVKMVGDSNALLTTILAGAAELSLGPRISVDQAVQIRDQWHDGTVLFSPTSWFNIYPQLLNPDPAVIADVRFRRALTHATDRQGIQDTLVGGLTSVVHSIVSPYSPDYKDVEASVVRYDYDVRQAKALLAELGYVKGGDDAFRDGGGQRLKVETRATAQLDHDPKALAAFSNDWRQLGIEVDEIVIPNQRVADREFRHTRPGFEVVSGNADPEAFEIFRGSRTPLPSNGFNGLNRSRYMNPRYDALLDSYYMAIPRSDRMSFLRQITHQLSDELVFIGLSYTTTHTFVGNRLKNITGRALNAVTGWNAEQWDVT